jgi:hypothetical protein
MKYSQQFAIPKPRYAKDNAIKQRSEWLVLPDTGILRTLSYTCYTRSLKISVTINISDQNPQAKSEVNGEDEVFGT